MVDSKKAFLNGMKDGIPIALGYFSVAFSLGIAAKNAGLSVFQGFLTSALNNASAGQYVGFTLMAASAPILELVLMTFIANARYLLMSCALSQKFSPKTSFIHRIILGFYLTDEYFSLSIKGDGFLNPYYTYGAIIVASPAWAFGTAAGIVAGNILPLRVVSALSVALYGMFLAIIIPPARKNKIIMGLIGVSFILSYIASRASFLAEISSGTKTIILTVLISVAAAILFPVKKEAEENGK